MKILTKLTYLALATLTMALSGCGTTNSASSSVDGYDLSGASNEGGSAFYEIFVGSYCDSNGDGTGDLNGIASKLDYLENLGVSYLWLTPVHPSPSYHKYDVKDYYAIDSSFGTLADFTSLVTKAKEHHIGIVMDMVFNHASVQSTWFQEWRDDLNAGKAASSSHSGDFVWSRNSKDGYSQDVETGVYVESRFSDQMPEFNLDSTSVRSEMANIMKFWLDKGVAGFRYDACTYYYYGDTVKNVSFMKYLVSTVQSYKPGAYQVGEAWVNNQSDINTYSSSGMHCFNFPTSEGNKTGSIGYLEGYTDGPKRFGASLVAAQSGIKTAGGLEPVYFVSNHDQDRWGSYFNGHKKPELERKLTVSAYLLTPGTPFMYYGEEIQMRGIRGSEPSDAMRRQAMLWGGDEKLCKQPEGYTYANQVTVGVKEALADGWSMVNHYRKVLSVRNKYNNLFQSGTYEVADLGLSTVCAFKITYDNATYYLVHNTLETAITATVSANTILADINTSKTASTLNAGTLTLQPFSSVLLASK
jgi:alpha-amylase